MSKSTSNKRIFVALRFETEEINLAKIQSAVVSAKRENCQELLLFGNKISGNLLALASTQITTKFVDAANTYDLLEHADKLPAIPTVTAPKQHIVPKFAFNRKRFIWYFFAAVYNVVLSFFSYFKLYLLIWGTVLLGLAVYCLVNKRYNQPPTNVKLE